MPGGNSQQTSSTSSGPWSGVRPYLKKGFNRLSNIYQRGAPDYYPRNTIAPMSGYTRGALDSLAGRAQQGSPVTDAAQGQLTDTLNGKYLDAGNPHFQGAVQAATRPMIENYQNNIMPGMDSGFSAAGRYGGGAHALGAAQAGQDLTQQIGDVSSGMAYQNYGDERQNQMRGMLFAPEMANQDYNDINQLGRAGEGYDAHNQSRIDANVNRWNYRQNAPWNFTKDYLGTLMGAPGGTSTTTQTQPRPNIFSSTAGGALAGWGMAPPGLGLIGAGLGGGAGFLSSLFH